jgi:hypothetical protein
MHTNHNTILIHHEHFHNLTLLGLTHQDDISFHQSPGITLTMTFHPTIQPLALVWSVLNLPTLQFFHHCHHHSLFIPPSKSSPGICLFLQYLSPPSHLISLQPGISCETSCWFHFLPQMYIYHLLTVNFNNSRAVFFYLHNEWVSTHLSFIFLIARWTSRSFIKARPINDCFCWGVRTRCMPG